jgi:hypothetical protein
MKKLFLIALAAVFTVSVSAQKFQMGLKAGANFPSPKYEATGVSNVKGKTGLTVGAFGTIGLLGINLQPEINYSTVNFEYTEASTVRKFKQTYLAIPVLLKFSIPLTGLSLYAGPQSSMLLSAKRNDVDVKPLLKDQEWSAIFGADFKIPLTPIILSARYQAGITDMYANGDKLKNNLINASVGFKF